ncbi:MAG: NAD(P)-dependent oxidoreductase, partial [Planctomycetota bacterium]|nr:NAD(P)-dependent oxidoreductase [Planctomycetota bacterium]
MPKIVMTDYLFEDMSVEEEIIALAGMELASNASRHPDDFRLLLKDADAVMVQFATLDRPMIESMERAKVIVRYGIGYDNVDIQAAQQQGIPVCNIPDYCIDEVADHTLAFILGATRGLRANCAKLVKGEWGLGTSIDQMRTLRDQTVGLIGAGRIGKEVISRLKPFKCNLLVFDPFLETATAKTLGVTLVKLHELLEQSDIV